MKQHHYTTSLEWTGNQGHGTTDYRLYSRDHEISIPEGLQPIPGSSDPAFRGDPGRYNPEELLLASLSACHMLWYLHLCAINKVIVLSYTDAATTTMQESPDGGGRIIAATLRPRVGLAAEEMRGRAQALHAEANAKCFIANSVNFTVSHQADFFVVA